MLGKLLKHEFRATGRIMGPLYLVLLATSFGANVSIRLMEGAQSRLLNVLAFLLMMAFVVAISAACIMSLVLMINRFRTNLMGDEGYVMFTLPASVHQLVWSKILVSTVWFIATGIAVMLSFCIMAYQVGMVTGFLREIADILSQVTAYYAINGAAFFAELLALTLVGCAAACLQFYAAMAVGYSFANHKTLLSVVFFFAFQFVMQILGTMGLFGIDDLNLSWGLNGVTALHVGMSIAIVAVALYGAVFYVITTLMLKKHLNLE